MISISETRDAALIGTLCGEVQALHHELHPAIFKPTDANSIATAIEKFMEDPACKAYVAWDKGEPVGHVLMYIKEYSESAFAYRSQSIYIDQIVVLQKHRRSGAGKLLLERAELLAQEHGIKKLELDHWSTNAVAAAYFRKNGYTIYKERLFKFI